MTKAKTTAARASKTLTGSAVGKISAGRCTKKNSSVPVSTNRGRAEEHAEPATRKVPEGHGRRLVGAAPETKAGGASVSRGKIGQLVLLMRRSGGASLAELTAATGWQAHSVRGAISGTVKKKLGLIVETHVTDGARRWRIAG